MRQELNTSFKHRVGSSCLIIEKFTPIFRRKYYICYVEFTENYNGEEFTSMSPRMRSYDEAYQWGWDQILEWVHNV